MPHSSKDKWIAAVIVALIALLLYSPFMMNLSQALFSNIGLEIAGADGHCPTLTGLVIHTLVFMFAVRAMI